MRRLGISGSLLLLHGILGLGLLAPVYVTPDSVGVFAWLRSAAVDRDLLFFDEWSGFHLLGQGFAWYKEVTPVGALANHWWVGSSLLSAPFWLLSHLLSLALPGRLFPDDGFFGLDLATLAWCAVLFGALAGILGVRLVRELEPGTRPGALSLAYGATLVGTPFFWYLYRMPLGTHAAGALLVAAVTWCSWRLVSTREGVSPELAGLCLGLAAITRLQHLLLLPALLLAAGRARWRLPFLVRLALGAALPLAVQGAAWLAVYGTPLGPLTSGANLQGATWSPWHGFPLAPVLFSSWHGLISWSPVVLLGMAGWLRLIRDGGARARFGWVLVAMFAAELLANVALDRYWWGGMGFGGRRFSDLAVPFLVGLAAWIGARVRAWTATVVVALAGWGASLAAAGIAGTLDLRRYVSSADLLHAVLAIPGRFAWSRLRSPLIDRDLLIRSAIALPVVVLVALVALAVHRRIGGRPRFREFALVTSCGSALLVASMLVAPTWWRAASEQERFRLVLPRAGSAGPLLDQRALLRDEIAWLENRGETGEAESRRREILAIERELAALGVHD